MLVIADLEACHSIWLSIARCHNFTSITSEISPILNGGGSGLYFKYPYPTPMGSPRQPHFLIL